MDNETFCDNSEIFLEKELLAPYTHLLKVRGKQLRVKIPLAFNHWLRLSEGKLREIVDTVNMLHVGSLLIDDIQDNSTVRRGLPSAHCVYGLPLTINTSVHVTNLVLKRVLKLGPKATELYTDIFLEVIRGQGIDIYWRDNFICPTEEEYKNMVKQKTGHMFLMAVRLCEQFSEYEHDLRELVLQMGLYFQIRDDYCNLTQQEALEEWPGLEDKQVNKVDSFCEDITEGKFSLPIIHAMKTSEGKEILSILRQRTQDVQLKKYCVSLLEKAGSLKYTRNVLSELDRSARAEVARLGGNPAMEAVLDELLTWKY
ncbi:geranylgeranyl pyrophosphate synthase-like isoform X2 [Pararge aegeria]|uniref:geranylgeranyl pyrophosphate synthase-like isoform X2 n=1 Tax=Pararge aegeria TaxID=116150 RepID=UPI0019D0FFB6|nr:geranylgeranyl pyrophosphate synthase-like isoform X2 [Pararge aegeria]XP_039749414.1 geranylgeranyl pyrophosphate synthase-like isoform X2 [Pararge aegeria]XP_039749415.1 geranylgeranyl pyrophosphate synthase-like isoform X2 [Pararge aegeria]